MRRVSLPASSAVLLAAALVGNACGSLNEGPIEIIDGQGGSGGGSGATTGSGGANEGGSSAGGDAGSPGMGGSGMGGASGGAEGGGPPTTGGDTGVGGSGGSGSGGAPGCQSSTECPVATPLCTDGTCTTCAMDEECKALGTTPPTPYCATNGSCVSCVADANCAAAAPICGTDSRCRKCAEGSECPSLACNAKGACATEAQVVYALAATGFASTDCGTMDKPCASLGTAASKLSATRPHLVLLPTKSTFIDGAAALPSGLTLFVFGNNVKIAPYDGTSAFVVSGGTVTFDQVVVEGTGTMSMTSMNSGIACSGGASLNFRRGSISKFGSITQQDGTPGITLQGCNATVSESSFVSNGVGVRSECSPLVGACMGSYSLTVERSLFEANVTTIYFDGASALIRNNIFYKNGFVDYCRVLQLRETLTTGIFAYNTLYGNENGCIYTGVVACGGTDQCGRLSSNITWKNLQDPGGTTTCEDQVYYSAPSLTNSLSETTWPGTGNISGLDPLFVDPSKKDFSLSAGSPALDKGSKVTAIMPTVDFYGNPRPRGAGPDIGAVELQ